MHHIISSAKKNNCKKSGEVNKVVFVYFIYYCYPTSRLVRVKSNVFEKENEEEAEYCAFNIQKLHLYC